MPVEDVVDWAERRRACGSLSLQRDALSRSFHFDAGHITNAGSNDPSEQLAQLLRKHRFVSEVALQDAFRVQADTGVLLGKILLMVGALDEDTLRKTLELKIRESVAEVLSWTDGTFVFEPDAGTQKTQEYRVFVNLREAIELGITRRQAWRALRAAIPHDEVRFWVRDENALLAQGGGLCPDLPSQIFAGATVGTMVLEQQAMRFDVMSELYSLVSLGVIAVDKRKAERTPEAHMSWVELDSAVRGRASGGDIPGALALVERALERQPEDADIRNLRDGMKRMLFIELSRKLLTSFRVPLLLKSPQELEFVELSSAERYLTARIDGRWDLLSLMRMSPLCEIEVLLTFQKLADRGIIVL